MSLFFRSGNMDLFSDDKEPDNDTLDVEKKDAVNNIDDDLDDDEEPEGFFQHIFQDGWKHSYNLILAVIIVILSAICTFWIVN